MLLRAAGLFAIATIGLWIAGCAHPPTPPAHLRALDTPLDRYVAAPDTNYAWQVATSLKSDGATAYAIRLTSQAWLTTNEVNRTVWQHWLTVIKPDVVEHSTALLFISGGNNRDDKPPKPSGELADVARKTRSVVAELKQVPNQPLVFGGDGRERVEDDLIAYTWDKYLRTGDARWPARLPMTKAAVRAMDTVTAFCAGPQGGGAQVESFVVAGGSKRGWTTWTTAVVDRRVVAICPIVIDVLNVVPSFVHHYRAYGFYAPAVQEYVDMGIMNWMGTPEFERLMRIVEPFEYRDRLTLPKLMLNATGDQFFLPDSSQFYFRQLKGPKFLRYVPNADHGLKDSDAWETLLAWYRTILDRRPFPRFDWDDAPDGRILLRAVDRPAEVRLWQANNPKARDFRLETLGAAWRGTTLEDEGHGRYVATVPRPQEGWTAYFMELTYPIPGGPPLKLTTGVRVTPDTLPFPAPQPRVAP